MTLDVVVVSWNTRDLLRRCLGAVAEGQDGVAARVFVSDNASSDGSVEMVRGEFPGVIVLPWPMNGGYAHAANRGIRAGRSPWVLLLNSDVLVPPRSLARLLEKTAGSPHLGAVSPRLVTADGSVWPTAQRFPGPGFLVARHLFLHALLPRRWLRWTHEHPSWRSTAAEVDWVSGAAVLFRREAIESIGLFDQRFFLFMEDVDVCRRLWARGWEVRYEPEVTMIHLANQSTRLNPGPASDRAQVEGFRSTLLYYRKHYGPAVGRLARMLILVHLCARAVRAAALLPLPRHRHAGHSRLRWIGSAWSACFRESA